MPITTMFVRHVPDLAAKAPVGKVREAGHGTPTKVDGLKPVVFSAMTIAGRNGEDVDVCTFLLGFCIGCSRSLGAMCPAFPAPQLYRENQIEMAQ